MTTKKAPAVGPMTPLEHGDRDRDRDRDRDDVDDARDNQDDPDDPEEDPQEAAARSPRGASYPRKVEAIKLGYYADMRRRPGDVFTIRKAKEFSAKWMRGVAADTPERVTTGRAALRQEHDEILRGKVQQLAASRGSTDHTPTGLGDPLGE